MAQESPGCDPAAFTKRLLELTNLERARAGLGPLAASPLLTDAAMWMAGDMAAGGYFDHLDRQGRRVGSRVYDFGYRAWKHVGENIAAGQQSPEDVFSNWMASPGHRRNILNPAFTEIGIGYAASSQGAYGTYWVQTFGHRPAYVISKPSN